MRRVIALDPGDNNTGVARTGKPGLVSVQTWFGYDATVRELRALMHAGLVDTVVCEEYRLYPWLAQQQGYSDFPTVQLIGAIRLICNDYGIERVMQPATIKEPAFKICARRGIEVPGKNQHEKDAFVHLYHYQEAHK